MRTAETINICKFMPVGQKDNDAISIIRFVRETDRNIMKKSRLASSYSMGLVLTGKGALLKNETAYSLTENNLFFVFPGEQYRFSPEEGLTYLYLDYLGVKASKIMSRLNVARTCPVFEIRDSRIAELWNHSLKTAHQGNLDLLGESCLLYAFALIGNTKIVPKPPEANDAFSRIRNYINAHFSEPGLSLESIGNALSYNKKYISCAFKKKAGTDFRKYLNALRVRHACALLQQGVTGIKDVAFLCGFNDPLYFSKVFKNAMGASPNLWIRAEKGRQSPAHRPIRENGRPLHKKNE